MQFKDVVTDPAQFRELMGEPPPPCVAKTIAIMGIFHCSKCVVRSNLWIPGAWPSLDGLPSLAQTMVDAAALPMPVAALEEIIKQDESERLY